MKHASLPVFPNWFPFNNMMFDGHMKVGQYEGVKTRNWQWDYRGSVLFYNSGRTAHAAVSAYGYRDAPSEHKMIIGVGELVDVRLLTTTEAFQMICNFNKLTARDVRRIIAQDSLAPHPFEAALYYFSNFGDYITPCRTGFFFKNLMRFKEPVKFNWPAGPVKPINTTIVAGSPLATQLKQSGF